MDDAVDEVASESEDDPEVTIIITEVAPEVPTDNTPKPIVDAIPGLPEIVIEMVDDSYTSPSQDSSPPDSSFLSALRSTWRSFQQAFRNSIHF